MAAAITTTATTLEGQAIEVLGKMQEAEAADPAADNRVQINPDTENGQITATVVLPITFSVSGGSISQTVQEYLS